LADTASRKWQITFNNPLEHGYNHERIKEILSEFKALVYWCMADEIGLEEETPHTHLYLVSRNPIRFSVMQNRFYGAHFESAKGTSQQNKEYIQKSGKWLNDEKTKTCLPDTFEEYGEVPNERRGKRIDITLMYEMVKDGLSNQEILEQVPSAMLNIDKIERTRSIIRDSEFAKSWRDLEVTYIFGKTGVGKTRSVMETYGYENCYRVTDYKHPFDSYDGQDVIIFEEFRFQFKMADLLNYLDGYPLLLPCRYFNRQACYTKVFIITNIPLERQYERVQVDSKETWYALIRRIDKIREFTASGVVEYDSTEKYFNRFQDINPHEQQQIYVAFENAFSTVG